MVERQLYLGLDLGPEYTQISCYNIDTGEPESVYHSEAKDTYLFPNILFYSDADRKTEEACEKPGVYDYPGWCSGAKASSRRFDEEGVLIDHIYQKVLMNESCEVDGRRYKAKELLIRLLVLHIKQFANELENFVIKKLVVTIADIDILIIKAVRELANVLNLSEDEFDIVSHLDSGLYYIFNQPESLRNNSVALFDFSNDGLDYYRVDITRNKTPEVVSVLHKDYRNEFNFATFGRNKEEMDEAFDEIVKKLMSETYISSVFLTGIGFAENWMKVSAATLCQGRRVFVGQNIYTKGACYRAVGGFYRESLGKYFIDTEYTVKSDIGISLLDSKDTFCPIVPGGDEWFNAKGKLNVFLNEANRLKLVYKNIITGKVKNEVIEIHGLPFRPPKTTKISLEVEFANAQKGAVIIRDVGFGDMFPTTNRIYRKEFEL
ncbi:MAG: DUF5716 family protein [Coprococcus sp.]